MSLLGASSTLFGAYGASRAYRAFMEQQRTCGHAADGAWSSPFLYTGILVNAFMYAHPLVMPSTCVCLAMRVGVEMRGLRTEDYTFAYREWTGIACSDTF